MSIVSYQEAVDFINDGSTTSANFKLQKIVDGVNEFIEDYIGYDITSWNKTDVIKFCDITKEELAFFVKTPNVKRLNKINWINYTWTKWFDNNSDYRIVQDRKLIVDDLWINYLNNLDDIYFEVQYYAGYSSIPWDLKYVALQIIELKFTKVDWRDVGSYKLWPRTVKFAGAEMLKDEMMEIKSVLNKYKTLKITG